MDSIEPKENQNRQLVQKVNVPSKPNETGSLIVQGHIKIFDPETKEVFVEKRA